jgi:hypothetical protein
MGRIGVALALVLWCPAATAQTKARPWQVRNWRQVEPLVGNRAGTRATLTQLRIEPGFVGSWRVIAVGTPRRMGPDCYEIATPAGQPNPVLITRCTGTYRFWFATQFDGSLKGP